MLVVSLLVVGAGFKPQREVQTMSESNRSKVTIEQFTSATAIQAEGARVGIVTCSRCGAAILLDPRDSFDTLKMHDDWHAMIEMKGGEP